MRTRASKASAATVSHPALCLTKDSRPLPVSSCIVAFTPPPVLYSSREVVSKGKIPQARARTATANYHGW